MHTDAQVTVDIFFISTDSETGHTVFDLGYILMEVIVGFLVKTDADEICTSSP